MTLWHSQLDGGVHYWMDTCIMETRVNKLVTIFSVYKFELEDKAYSKKRSTTLSIAPISTNALIASLLPVPSNTAMNSTIWNKNKELDKHKVQEITCRPYSMLHNCMCFSLLDWGIYACHESAQSKQYDLRMKNMSRPPDHSAKKWLDGPNWHTFSWWFPTGGCNSP